MCHRKPEDQKADKTSLQTYFTLQIGLQHSEADFFWGKVFRWTGTYEGLCISPRGHIAQAVIQHSLNATTGN